MRFTANCGSILVFRRTLFLVATRYTYIDILWITSCCRVRRLQIRFSTICYFGCLSSWTKYTNRARASIGQLAHRHNEYGGGGDGVRGYCALGTIADLVHCEYGCCLLCGRKSCFRISRISYLIIYYYYVWVSEEHKKFRNNVFFWIATSCSEFRAKPKTFPGVRVRLKQNPHRRLIVEFESMEAENQWNQNTYECCRCGKLINLLRGICLKRRMR